ncbi:N-acetyltransferase [Anaerobacillus arseniciselenatis]|uniref:N-acetyltransferase n=1 Tax=Anaerobacillus arseniciselenatis TaxID=85682 RepID=A0A1S2LEX7_9BACI|nr:GNAT family N-acetyltransferase [Anaerobacillus arseniciselenatis]OIJ10916.1 N-acetyltransferase [Anaerobacillus arseniciselenatis]
MKHQKTYNALELQTGQFTLIIEGPLSAKEIETYKFHEGLTAFRPSEKQKKALLGIADLPEGRIIVARHNDTIVGYATFVYPDELERWSQGKMEDLIELGAIEVAAPYRGCKIGKNLLKVSMMDDAMEDYITITTEYYWHWDLKGTGLSIWDYRKVMEKMMSAGGLIWYATDDPEICSHPANCLMVRIGKRVPQESIQKFDLIRFQNRFMY